MNGPQTQEIQSNKLVHVVSSNLNLNGVEIIRLHDTYLLTNWTGARIRVYMYTGP